MERKDMSNQNIQKKKEKKGLLWIALLLGLLMPFILYFSLKNGQSLLAVISFALLACAYALTVWKG